MSLRLTEFVDPWRLAGVGRVVSGSVELAELPRLAEVLQSISGEVQFRLEFFSGEKKRPRIKGFVRANLAITCQRCLGAVIQPVDSELNLAVIEVPEEAESLPEECDPVWAEDEQIKLLDLIEEELLLAIPQVSRHPLGECPDKLMDEAIVPDEFQSHEGEAAGNEIDDDNPFAILAGLKKEH